tara:strand:- start:329 stop:1846 length:1518 start_codon:yes stop_codon:yes gene_type:complete
MKPLVIFELANNHMGKISHAKTIIKKYYNLSKKFRNKIDFAIKFQYRDSETFIHSKYLNSDDKQILRFKSTFFTRNQWKEIINFSRKKFKLICTPFDEISAKNVVKDKFDFLKIASCSATDWPLVEYIAKNCKNKKIICSLGGLHENEISNVISFFSKKTLNIRFLYCVAKYPTEMKDLNLLYFKKLRERYGECISGISLHEIPDGYLSGAIGLSLGAKIFEKHIGVEKGKNIKLNKYSADEKQTEKWLTYLEKSIDLLGSVSDREKNVLNEKTQISKFKRGIYVKKDNEIKANSSFTIDDLSFQFPALKNQLTANEFSKFSYFKSKVNLKSGNEILRKQTVVKNTRSQISFIRHKIREIVKKSNVVVPQNSRLEISHHYGLENFYKHGLSMITVVNQDYCKKYLILLNKQSHPAQYHKIKQETFVVIFGKIYFKTIHKNKIYEKTMLPGDISTIPKGVIHEFRAISKNGAVIEEISSNHKKTDSYYLDSKITNNKNRKSVISFY